MSSSSVKKTISLALTAVLCAALLPGCAAGTAGSGASASSKSSVPSAVSVPSEASVTSSAPAEEAFVWPDSVQPKEQTYHASLPREKAESDIFVEPVPDLAPDFICGADVSSVLSEEESGVVYRDAAGTERDVFELLADGGTNWIRVRVWNDPYDEQGRGYGGGNCDTERAAVIGARAAAAGQKLLVDFHYSDFWADPAKQMEPKAWAGMSSEEKEAAVYEFTRESLTKILAAGADVGMVQIGNEINNGCAGIEDEKHVCSLLSSAAKAVREVSGHYGLGIKIAVHYTDIQDREDILRRAKLLESQGVDYDVFGVSYYMFWHGSLENMTSLLREIRETYGKETAVLETSYMFTEKDGDGSGNSVDGDDLAEGYSATVQGQADALRDVCAAASEAGALGVFWWEPCWVPVNYYAPGIEKAGEKLEANQKAWEEYGSGWASKFAAGYDPRDAGRYYGGSSWDNQAWFDFEGKALSSLYTYAFLRYGAEGTLAVDHVETPVLELLVGDSLTLPETVEVAYNDRTRSGPSEVTWNDDQAAAVDTSDAGDFTVEGTLPDGSAVTAEIHVTYHNLITDPSLESGSFGDWTVDSASGSPVDIQEKANDAHSGNFALHFWSQSDMDFTVSQTVTADQDGTYALTFYAQGGDTGPDDIFQGFVLVNGEEAVSGFTLKGWAQWQEVTIGDLPLKAGDTVTAGVRAVCQGGAWGTFDDFDLSRKGN